MVPNNQESLGRILEPTPLKQNIYLIKYTSKNMNLLKKLLIPLLVIGTSVMAAEYKIGDKMPSHENEVNLNVKPWAENGVTGLVHYYDINNDRVTDFTRISRICKGKEIIFAYWDGKKLYLDNNNDGYIDSVHNTVSGRSASKDAPECDTKI